MRSGGRQRALLFFLGLSLSKMTLLATSNEPAEQWRASGTSHNLLQQRPSHIGPIGLSQLSYRVKRCVALRILFEICVWP